MSFLSLVFLFIADFVPSVHGPSTQLDIPLWPWGLPVLRGPCKRMPNVQEIYREENFALLTLGIHSVK